MALCATDLSAASEAAIENETCLECLGRIGIDTIHLVTVVPAKVHSGTPGMDFDERRRQGLDRYRTVIEAAGFDVETHVVRGTPYRRINGIAEAVRADVSVVGSRGQRPLENRLIGSTARTLARTTVVPLVVNRVERAPDDPDVARELPFQRILFATDFSEHAGRAFDAFSYLRHATEEVTLVHVRSPKDQAVEAESTPREQRSRAGEYTRRLGDSGGHRGPAGRSRRGDPRRRSGGNAVDDPRRVQGAKPHPAAPVGQRFGGDRRTSDGTRLPRPAATGGLRVSPPRRSPRNRLPQAQAACACRWMGFFHPTEHHGALCRNDCGARRQRSLYSRLRPPLQWVVP